MAVKNFNNQRGIAILEILPVIVMFIAFFSLLFGFWGAIHSGTLQSIAARHYSFEVINLRTHIEIHRDYTTTTPQSIGRKDLYNRQSYRSFAVVHSQGRPDPELVARTRGIGFFSDINRENSQEPEGNFQAAPGSSSAPNYIGTRFEQALPHSELHPPRNPLWIMTGYGICLQAQCSDE